MMESRISALVDGELERDEAIALLSAIKEQPQLQQAWLLDHLIGDALRQTHSLSPGFNASFAQRLAQEPTILAPHRFPQARRPLVALSAAASVAAVSLVVWVALQFNAGHSSDEVANTVVAEAEPASALPMNVGNYLLAHKEYSNVAQESNPYQRAVLEKPQGGGR